MCCYMFALDIHFSFIIIDYDTNFIGFGENVTI